MNRKTLSLALVGMLIEGSIAVAQTNAPANSLTRALATFAAIDVNHDGKLSAQELLVVPIDRQEFLAHDHDKDGTWSKDEFLIYYRRRLLLAGQQVGADLEAETARVQALRKTKATEEAQNRSSATASDVKAAQVADSGTSVTLKGAAVAAGSQAAPSPALAAIEAGLENALQKLEQRAAAGHASREDFQQVQDQLIARARAAANAPASPDSPAAYGTEAYRKMLQSLERLEKRANEGLYSPAEYQEFRDMIIHRSRQIAKKELSTESGGSGAVSPEIAAIEKGLTNAIDELEQRAAAGHATREDFQKVRDQMIARARAAASASAPSGANAPSTPDIYQKMMQVLDRLEKRAAEGGYTREEYQELRQLFIHRAREIQAAQNANGTGSVDVASASRARDTAAPAPNPQRPPAATDTARDPNVHPVQQAQPAPPVQPAPARPASDAKDASKSQRPPPPSESRAKGDPSTDPQRPPR